MTSIPSDSALPELVHELCALPHETEWLEFKHNNGEPEEIGQNIPTFAKLSTLLWNSWSLTSTHRLFDGHLMEMQKHGRIGVTSKANPLIYNELT
jgi:hypothetical protein